MKQNNAISIINAFLCLCVCMIHITSAPLAEATAGSAFYVVVFLINKVLCFSVPGFIFLSGFKLFGKYCNKHIHWKSFFVTRIKKIVVPYVVSVLIYFVYFYAKKWVSLGELPRFLLLGTLAAHFYYVVIAVQLYVIFPLLKCLFEKHIYATVVSSLLCTVVFNHFVRFTYVDRFFGTYVFYFVLGMLFAKHKQYKNSNLHLALWALCFAAAAAVHLYFSYISSLGVLVYKYGNLINIVYVTSAVCTIYGLCDRYVQKSKAMCTASKALGAVSYNVYLYHILIIFVLLYDIFPKFGLYAAQKLVIAFVVVYFCVFVYAYVKSYIGKKHA